YLEILADHGDATDLANLLQLSDDSLQARLLPALATAARVRNLRPACDLGAAIGRMLESTNPDLRAGAIRLSGVWKLEAFRARAGTVALDTGADAATRRAAIEALAAFGGEAAGKILSRLADDMVPAVQSAAIAALCGVDLEAAARIAGERLARLSGEPELSEVISS